MGSLRQVVSSSGSGADLEACGLSCACQAEVGLLLIQLHYIRESHSSNNLFPQRGEAVICVSFFANMIQFIPHI